jgi:hypothetical protein
MIDFQPTLFDVAVDMVSRNIAVHPVEAASEIVDIEPSGFLILIANWQFTIMSSN